MELFESDWIRTVNEGKYYVESEHDTENYYPDNIINVIILVFFVDCLLTQNNQNLARYPKNESCVFVHVS